MLAMSCIKMEDSTYQRAMLNPQMILDSKQLARVVPLHTQKLPLLRMFAPMDSVKAKAEAALTLDEALSIA